MKGAIHVACLSQNRMVMLNVAGSCLKRARFVQCQVEVLFSMVACNFIISWLHLC